MDGFDQDAPAPEPGFGLAYPCGAPPDAGQAKEVAPGVLWARHALPWVLDHINVWMLEDEDGWTVVDTGVQLKPVADAWRSLMSGPMLGRPVRRVIVTHMHPDHIGMAGWMVKKTGARLWVTRLEYVFGRMLVADTGRAAPEDGARFFHAAGWTEAQVQHWRERFGMFGQAVFTIPDSYRRIQDGEVLAIGGRAWRVVVGSGHSPEHACLYSDEVKVLIAGDQVLPRISSNVSVFPTEPDADPLGDWRSSLAKLKRQIPDDVLVLPSHGEPFTGLHARIDALEQGHASSLRRLERTLAEPKRAVDVFGTLFARKIGDGLLGMATGESLAHLNHLMAHGRAERTTDENGVWWFRAV